MSTGIDNPARKNSEAQNHPAGCNLVAGTLKQWLDRRPADGRVRARYDLAVMTLIRTLLIWLVALAVPMQGAAAATMVFCGPNHHGVGASSQVLPAAPAMQAHHGETAGSAHQHADHAAFEDVFASVATSAVVSTNAGDAIQKKCSACASCCSVGAILSSLPAVLTPVFVATVFSTIVPSVDTRVADCPDRPPRIVLA